ncbi:MAG TPA: glycosyltransferase family 4 protein [Candidatus Limnocylindria bacterium]|nr:glycosyltransferase family 4 protein [Candidatus Limnocylindria bacterium]
MRVLVLANNDVGLWRFRRELLEALVGAGHEVHVSLPQGRLVPEITGLGCRFIPTEVDRRGMNPLKDLRLLARYRGMLREVRPGAVLTYTVKPNVYGGLAARMLGVPQVANVTGLGTAVEGGGPLGRLVLLLYRVGLARARRVFFQNRRDMEFLQGKGAVRAPSALVPGSGVNLRAHSPMPYPDAGDGVRFLFIGRLMRSKGVEELLAAFREVKARHPDASLTLIGEPDEGDGQRFRDMDARGEAIYLGYRPDIHEQIARSHCVVLPSWHEGMANTLLEAAATARPVIASRVPGCLETFDEGVTGLGCGAKDAPGLRDAMLAFIAMPQADRARMGEAGRRKMEAEFDRGIVVDAYLREIDSIGKEGKR